MTGLEVIGCIVVLTLALSAVGVAGVFVGIYLAKACLAILGDAITNVDNNSPRA